MTFENALIAANYFYQPECGCYVKDDKNGNVHTYLELEHNLWNYEKYDANDDLIVSKSFTLS